MQVQGMKEIYSFVPLFPCLLKQTNTHTNEPPKKPTPTIMKPNCLNNYFHCSLADSLYRLKWLLGRYKGFSLHAAVWSPVLKYFQVSLHNHPLMFSQGTLWLQFWVLQPICLFDIWQEILGLHKSAEFHQHLWYYSGTNFTWLHDLALTSCKKKSRTEK